MSFNLTRLIGTDLLMAGFESFLRYWFDAPGTRATPNRNSPPPELFSSEFDGWVPAFDELPDDVRRFYELDDEWEFLPDICQDHLLTYPVKFPNGCQTYPAGDNHICIMRDREGDWVLSVAQEDDGSWRCYRLDSDTGYEAWNPMDGPVSQHLLAYAFKTICTTAYFPRALAIDYGPNCDPKDIFIGSDEEAKLALERLQQSSTPPSIIFTQRRDVSSAPATWDPQSRDEADFWFHQDSGLLWSWTSRDAVIGIRGHREQRWKHRLADFHM